MHARRWILPAILLAIGVIAAVSLIERDRDTAGSTDPVTQVERTAPEASVPGAEEILSPGSGMGVERGADPALSETPSSPDGVAPPDPSHPDEPAGMPPDDAPVSPGDPNSDIAVATGTVAGAGQESPQPETTDDGSIDLRGFRPEAPDDGTPTREAVGSPVQKEDAPLPGRGAFSAPAAPVSGPAPDPPAEEIAPPETDPSPTPADPPALAPPRPPPPPDLILRIAASSATVPAGGTLRLDVLIAGARDVVDIPFSLTYDPASWEYLGATEGTFLDQDGAATIFFARNSPDAGVVTVGLSRLDRSRGANGAGVIASLELRALAEAVPRVGFNRPGVRDSQGRFLRAAFAGLGDRPE